MKIKNILITTSMLSSIAFAGIQDVENLLNFTADTNIFKCENTKCTITDYVKVNEDKKVTITIKEGFIKFNDSAQFNFTFDKDKSLEQVQKNCKDKSEVVSKDKFGNKTNEKSECLNTQMIDITSNGMKGIFKEINDISISNIKVDNEGSINTIDNININLDKRLLELGSKDLKEITIKNLEFETLIKVSGLTSQSIEKDLKTALTLILPRSETMNYNNNTVTTLKTVEKINQKILSMYSLLIKEIVKNNNGVTKNINLSFNSKLSKDNSLNISFKTDTQNDTVGTVNSQLSFNISNLSSVMNILNNTDFTKEESSLFLMSLAQNTSFSSLVLNSNFSKLVEIDKKLLNTNKDYMLLKNEISNILNSEEFKNESNKLSKVDLFKYKVLELNNSESSFEAINKNNTPLMMLLMVINQGQDINKVLEIKETFK